MAGVSVDGGGGGRKKLDSEINMIPMIDLLMVTISFLLITAVWVQSSRLEASANVPGVNEVPPCEQEPGGCKPEPRLHVQTTDPTKFVLVWKEGPTVVRSVEVPRSEADGHKNAKPGQIVYPRSPRASPRSGRLRASTAIRRTRSSITPSSTRLPTCRTATSSR